MDRNRCVTVTHEGGVSTVTFDAPPQNLLDIDLTCRYLAHITA